MKTLKRAFENLFTIVTSEEEKNRREMYRTWAVEREKAAKFGDHHVQEIDAIFSRSGL
jgi:hypothetical protein